MHKYFSAPLMGHSDGRYVEEQTLRMLREGGSGVKPSAFMQMGKEAVELVRRYLASLRSGSDCIEEEHITDCCCKSMKRVVLHVDLNKTILMSDAVQDASMHNIVNMLLSECCWGRMELKGKTPFWEPVGRLATDRPCDPELMTYRHFLDTFLLPYDDNTGPEADIRNTQVKKRRQELKRRFTEDGQPGEMFIGVHKALCKKLALPENEAVGEFLQGRKERHIVPSFFQLLLFLQEEDLDFTIVFRTFGSDMADVAAELNLFATGQHPSYPGVTMDGSDGRVDIRLLEENGSFGAFYRDKLNAEGTFLGLGLPLDVISQKTTSFADIEAATQPVCSPKPQGNLSDDSQPSGRLLSGFQEVFSGLQACVNQPGCHAMALRDYYPFWKHHNERSHAGKLLLLEPHDSSCVHLFLDDNIGYDIAHIVDARDVVSGAPVDFERVNGYNLIKVEALNAILDTKYFIRTVETHVRRIAERRSGGGSPRDSEDRPTPSPPPGPMSPFNGPIGSSGNRGSLSDLMQARTVLEQGQFRSIKPLVSPPNGPTPHTTPTKAVAFQQQSTPVTPLDPRKAAAIRRVSSAGSLKAR